MKAYLNEIFVIIAKHNIVSCMGMFKKRKSKFLSFQREHFFAIPR